jgi:mRNA interferase RelE/StbE
MEKKAEKELDKIPPHYQEKILALLPVIAENPFCGKKLKGKHKNIYSYRVWPYRILYRVYDDVVLVVVIHVGHRQGIY